MRPVNDSTFSSIEEESLKIPEMPPNETQDDSVSSCQISDALQKTESNRSITEEHTMTFEDDKTETSQEAPSQSYEQLVSGPNNVPEVPSQSVKSKNCRKALQSRRYESMRVDNNALRNVSAQSYKLGKLENCIENLETDR